MSSASAQPKVLRLAVVADELVCEELHQEKPGGVSVGTDYRSNVIVFGQGAPSHHPLFDYRNGRYVLDLPAGVRGKLRIRNRTINAAALKKKLGDNARIPLDPSAKGKLLLGQSLVMFQFAAPKVPEPKLPFPKEFKFGFAVLLGTLGSIYVYSQLFSALTLGGFFAWASFVDIPEDREIEIEERFLIAVNSPKLREKEEKPEEVEEEDTLAEESEDVKVVDREQPKDKPEPKLTEKPQQFSQKAMAEARGVGVARVLGTYGGPGEGTVFDVIQNTENNLGELFAQGMTTTVLADGGDISPFVPGGEGISARGAAVQTDGFETAGGPTLDKKDMKRERKVQAVTKVASVDSEGGDAKALRATINHRKSALQWCYENALATQPSLAGKMAFTISISVMGTVTSVNIDEDTVGSDKVVSCARAKIKGWRFPTNGAQEGAEVSFTMVFSGS